MKTRTEVRLLLEVVDQAYNQLSWHGTTLRGAVRGLSPEAASWRPGPGRHNIREVVLHAAYWKYASWRKLTGAKRGSFALGGSNWFPRPDTATRREWAEEVALLDQAHDRLRAAIADSNDAELAGKAGASRYTRAFLIQGIAAHDLYHAGQIQLLKRLFRSK